MKVREILVLTIVSGINIICTIFLYKIIRRRRYNEK